jgi:PRTRC genetic system ThiF family protein
MTVFDPNLHIQTVTVVGLGGTGAQVARSVARIVYDMRAARLHTPKIVLIDPDPVEHKNVGRQLYTAADIGQKKAHVLMRRFNAALGLDIASIDQAVDADRHFERSGSLIVGCVDNHLARRELARVKGAVWIDAGNHVDAGQVVIGNTGDRETALRNLDGHKGKTAYLPHAGLLFPALLEPEPPAPQPVQAVSCAELVEAGSQHLLINDWVAAVTAQYVYKLLHREPVRSFLTYVSADALSVRSLPICREEITSHLDHK